MRRLLFCVRLCFNVSLLGLGILYASSVAHAQVREDRALPQNSRVRTERNRWVITEGTQRGTNLFHSFEVFSVPQNATASFQEIDQNTNNIFVRVTGRLRSDINGTIETLQSNGELSGADFFLLNPNGILFGPDARLDIGGSFLATTADSIVFDDGTLFSAVTPQESPLLTISTPVGLQFGDTPGPILNRSARRDFSSTGDRLRDPFGSAARGLQVFPGETLALVGGPVTLEGGWLVAGSESSQPGGRVELASVASNSLVSLTSLDRGWNLGFAEVEGFDDIWLSGSLNINTSGDGGGAITLHGRTIQVEGGAQLISVTEGVGNGEPLRVNASDRLIVTGFSPKEFNSLLLTLTMGSGSAGDIRISTQQLHVRDAAFIASDSWSRGSGGDIFIHAAESVDVIGYTVDPSTIGTSALAGGDAGGIELSTQQLNIRDGGEIVSTTAGRGQGGDVTIDAVDSVRIIGIATQPGLPDDERGGNLLAQTLGEQDNAGNAGNLTVATNYLLLESGGQIASTTLGSGDGGVLTVQSEAIELRGIALDDDGSPFLSSSRDGRLPYPSGLFAGANPGSTGDGGLLRVEGDRLTLSNGAVLQTNTYGSGNAGSIEVRVTDFIDLNGVAPEGLIPTSIAAISGGLPGSGFREVPSATGSSGDIRIETGTLRAEEGAVIATSSINPDAAGAGQLQIRADAIALRNNAQLNTRTESGGGESAAIALRSLDLLTLQGSSQITTQAGLERDGGNGGNIDIQSRFILAEPLGDNDIAADAGEGNGGDVSIRANVIGLVQQERPTSPISGITASSEQGLSGTITISSPDTDPTRGLLELPTDIIDVSSLVTPDCRPADPNDPQSEFVVTGRGGLPQSPIHPRQGDTVHTDWVTLPTQRSPMASSNSLEPSDATGPIVEAQGWAMGDNGKVVLVAQTSTVTLHDSPLSIPDCYAR